jgi:hypothetical protein
MSQLHLERFKLNYDDRVTGYMVLIDLTSLIFVLIIRYKPEQQEAMTKYFKYHSPEYRAIKTHTSLQQSEHGIMRWYGNKVVDYPSPLNICHGIDNIIKQSFISSSSCPK